MKQDPFANVYRALTPKELAEMFMNPNAPKTEAEHWAVREIERLRARERQLEQVREAALNACADWYLSLRVDDRDGIEYVEPNFGLMKSMGTLSEVAWGSKP